MPTSVLEKMSTSLSVDRVIEGEAAREADPHPVLGDFFEVGGGGGAELGAQIAASARRDHHRLAQSVRLHETGFELLRARQIQLDAHEALVHRALEEA